jgi:hypothetical protein
MEPPDTRLLTRAHFLSNTSMIKGDKGTTFLTERPLDRIMKSSSYLETCTNIFLPLSKTSSKIGTPPLGIKVRSEVTTTAPRIAGITAQGTHIESTILTKNFRIQ